MMKRITISIMMLISTMVVMAQTASPTVTFLGARNDDKVREEITMNLEEDTEANAVANAETEAPANLTCKANVECPEGYGYNVEWRFTTDGGADSKPFLTRFDDDITYDLKNDGGTLISLYVSFTNKNDGTVNEKVYGPIKITVKSSKLTCTDGLSPNGDNRNDKLKIDCQSIVECTGCIFNRWGQKLHTFTIDNLAEGWDGYVGGRVVKDGVYFVNINAVGSDGIRYKIKKAINVLKGYRESNETDGSDL